MEYSKLKGSLNQKPKLWYSITNANRAQNTTNTVRHDSVTSTVTYKHKIDIIQHEPTMQSRERRRRRPLARVNHRKEKREFESEQRQGLALPMIIIVPDNSPAPLEGTSAVCLPRGAASRFDPVVKLGPAEHL